MTIIILRRRGFVIPCFRICFRILRPKVIFIRISNPYNNVSGLQTPKDEVFFLVMLNDSEAFPLFLFANNVKTLSFLLHQKKRVSLP